MVVSALGIKPSAILGRINEHWQTYQQAKENRESVRQNFVLVLALFTLLLLVSAIWVGSALAKMMTGPIQRLAEATQAVSEGRFDVRVDVEAPDELGLLVRSFNRMLEELRLGRLNVERSTLDLQRSNVELEKRRKYIETILENSANRRGLARPGRADHQPQHGGRADVRLPRPHPAPDPFPRAVRRQGVPRARAS